MRPFLLSFSLAALGGPLAFGLPLTGSGSNLPLPSATGPTAPGIAPTITNGSGGFTGSWSASANSLWHGTFSATGSYPSSGSSGTSDWNFTGLFAGYLPSGTFVRLGDVDNETAETFTLTAFDGSGQITAAWLDQPVFLSGATPSQFQQANLPSWSFDSSTGVYTFTGVSINTLLTVSLRTNQDLTRLLVDKGHVNNGFGLAAPEVPEPGAFLLLSSGLVGLGLLRRQRRA